MSKPAIQSIELSKHYGRNAALDSITLDIPEEGIIGLIGRNGSGKTTLLKLCAGLLDVTSGSLLVFGAKPMDNLSVLQDVIYSYHNIIYYKSLKLRTIMDSYAAMFSSFDLEFARKLLRYFGLEEDWKYTRLSQGMAGIFNFTCALASRARLTLLDEPLLGMDITVRKTAYEVLLRDFTEHPRTIIVSSHMLAELEAVLSDILLIDEGRLVLFDNIDNLRQSAYRIEGEKQAVDAFSAGRAVIYRRDGLGCEAVIRELYDQRVLEEVGRYGLRVSTVRPEDLCIYLTRENKEGELECLWTTSN